MKRDWNKTAKTSYENELSSAELRKMIDKEISRRDQQNKGGMTLMGGPSLVFGKDLFKLEQMYEQKLQEEKINMNAKLKDARLEKLEKELLLLKTTTKE